MIFKNSRASILLTLAAVTLLSSCSRLGWGVLLWSIEDPPVLSGTVLPVYIKSNIDKVWVVGIPETLRRGGAEKVEVPLSQLEFFGSRRKAVKWAGDFSEYAYVYAENLQDGLPIRDAPDNNSKRVYRLRLGEVIKILSAVHGNPPISTTGDPLPGEWYRVLTHDGIIGHCFSYRLKLFEYGEGPMQASSAVQKETVADPELETVLSRTWSPESYQQMINSRRINIQEMEKKYRFDPGQETGIARIILPDLERQFQYDGIYPNGENSWRFEGSNLQMILRSSNTLAVQFTEGTGTRRTMLFVSLPTEVNDIIIQENARREGQFMNIYNQGPVFTSSNYGTITFLRTGDFTWTGYDLLVPQFISAETNGKGRVNMDIYISPLFEAQFNGAFSFRFTDIRQNSTIYFMYTLNNDGLRLEVVPEFGIEDVTVTQRASSPTVLYFFRDSPL